MVIAGIHVASWQAAYAGIMPTQFLAGLSIEKRALMWRETIEAGTYQVAIASVKHEPAGWVAYGRCRDADKNPACAEIIAINLHPSGFRQGIGSSLMSHACVSLRGTGYSEVSLWTLMDNLRARTFYEGLGFVPDGGLKEFRIDDIVLGEIRYWRSLTNPLPGLPK